MLLDHTLEGLNYFEGAAQEGCRVCGKAPGVYAVV